MLSEVLQKLVKDVQRLKSESQTIELKSAVGGCPKVFDTLSSFSNQEDGGIIIFGVDESADYAVAGVYDVEDLMKRVTEQCKQMEPVVRALFTICEIDGKNVVAAEIPAVDVMLRPVFYRGVGRIKGSYIRVGDADEQMTETEIYGYEAFRRRVRDDSRVVEEADWKWMDSGKLSDYLAAVKIDRVNLSTNVSDDEILELMGIRMHESPTLAGILMFCKYPQTYFPQFSITAVALDGIEMGVLGEDGSRFIDNKRFTGTIPEMLDGAVEFVRRNSRQKTIINEMGRRADKLEYPLTAVREAILNALVHRDYSIHSENTPIRIEMYRDRLEIVNRGGLYGKMTIDALGKIPPETRNSVLANILEILKITENRYSGIATMRREMIAANLPPPVFSSVHGEFKVVFKNDYYSRDESPESRVLAFCSIPRSRGEIVSHIGMSGNYVKAKLLDPLVKSGQLRLTMPDKPQSSKQRFVSGNV